MKKTKTIKKKTNMNILNIEQPSEFAGKIFRMVCLGQFLPFHDTHNTVCA